MSLGDNPLPLLVGAASLSAGALYWIYASGKPSVHPLDCYLRSQSFLTDEEVDVKIRALSHALNSLQSSESNRMIGIQSPNCPEWFITLFACAATGHVVVPLYDTFGEEALEHILEQTQISVVTCNSIDRARSLARGTSSALRDIIVFDCLESELSELRKTTPSIRFHSLQHLIQTHKSKTVGVTPMRDPDQLFLICYTSGSSGLPKGVPIRHGQFVRTLTSMCLRLENKGLSKTTVHLCYLPLAHILEQLASLSSILFGGRVGFLTSGLTSLLDDLQALRPTYLYTVPRVLSRIYSSLTQRLANYPLLTRLLQYAIDRKVRDLERDGVFHSAGLWDMLFFRKVRNALGGRIDLIVCGGAPISADVFRFTRAAFGCPVLQAYGLTETCGILSMTYFGDIRNNRVGALIPGVVAKLGDVPSMGLSVSNGGIGELQIKGPNCSDGYFQDPEKSAELIDIAGWLHTGDLAQWDEDGSLQIVGRCKASFKLAQGEYVSPEKVESVYQLCSLIDQVYVDGRSLHNFAIGIVVPNTTELCNRVREAKLAPPSQSNNGHANQFKATTSTGDEDYVEWICNQDSVKQLILNELTQLGRKQGLKGFEQIKAIHLTSSPFTVENQLLTANLKLSRAKLRDFFDPIIDELYAKSDLAT